MGIDSAATLGAWRAAAAVGFSRGGQGFETAGRRATYIALRSRAGGKALLGPYGPRICLLGPANQPMKNP
jgi:hypothetical protein